MIEGKELREKISAEMECQKEMLIEIIWMNRLWRIEKDKLNGISDVFWGGLPLQNVDLWRNQYNLNNADGEQIFDLKSITDLLFYSQFLTNQNNISNTMYSHNFPLNLLSTININQTSESNLNSNTFKS